MHGHGGILTPQHAPGCLLGKLQHHHTITTHLITRRYADNILWIRIPMKTSSADKLLDPPGSGIPVPPPLHLGSLKSRQILPQDGVMVGGYTGHPAL